MGYGHVTRRTEREGCGGGGGIVDWFCIARGVRGGAEGTGWRSREDFRILLTAGIHVDRKERMCPALGPSFKNDLRGIQYAIVQYTVPPNGNRMPF